MELQNDLIDYWCNKTKYTIPTCSDRDVPPHPGWFWLKNRKTLQHYLADSDGRLHRANLLNKKSHIRFNVIEGVLLESGFDFRTLIDGKPHFHRTDGPAKTYVDTSGCLVQKNIICGKLQSESKTETIEESTRNRTTVLVSNLHSSKLRQESESETDDDIVKAKSLVDPTPSELNEFFNSLDQIQTLDIELGAVIKFKERDETIICNQRLIIHHKPNGTIHRAGLPAIETSDGKFKLYAVNGRCCTGPDDQPSITISEPDLFKGGLSKLVKFLQKLFNKPIHKWFTSDLKSAFIYCGDPDRSDLPAIFYHDGSSKIYRFGDNFVESKTELFTCWYKNDMKHREDGPAVIHKNGDVEYWQNDMKHREDGPAVIHKNGDVEFWRDGKKHCKNGPAVIHKNGDVEYWQNDMKHRENGPAVMYRNGDVEFWRDGKKHCENGPAVIHQNAKSYQSKLEFWRKGKRHRKDGPAVILENGTEKWYLNHKLHRKHGPAVIKHDGEIEYWKFDKLHRDDGPAVISGKTQKWFKNGLLHRTDGPAIVYKNGYEFWVNGKLHCVDGPAVSWESGVKRWFLEGKRIEQDDFGEIVAKLNRNDN